MQMDKARIQTDKKLKSMEKEISRVYKTYPALLSVEKEYAEYLEMVKEKTADLYTAYVEDPNDDTKKAYMDEVRKLTIGSKKYNELVKKTASVLAEVNEKALDISNKAMVEIYAINYNQVADECKRVGIKVNGNK